MTQGKLARELDITEVHLSGILNGHRMPGSRLAKALTEKTGVPLSVWVAQDPSNRPKHNPEWVKFLTKWQAVTND